MTFSRLVDGKLIISRSSTPDPNSTEGKRIAKKHADWLFLLNTWLEDQMF